MKCLKGTIEILMRPDKIHYHDSTFFQQVFRFHTIEVNMKYSAAMIQEEHIYRFCAETLHQAVYPIMASPNEYST